MMKYFVTILTFFYISVSHYFLPEILEAKNSFIFYDWQLFSSGAKKYHYALLDKKSGHFLLRDKREIVEESFVNEIAFFYNLQKNRVSIYKKHVDLCNFKLVKLKGSLYSHYLKFEKLPIIEEVEMCRE